MKTTKRAKAEIQTYKVPEVIFYKNKKNEVESLKQFEAVQIQIDSLEDIKDRLKTEIYNSTELDIQQKLNLIFNQ